MTATLEIGGEEGNFKWEVVNSYVDSDGNEQLERILAHGGFATKAEARDDAVGRYVMFKEALDL